MICHALDSVKTKFFLLQGEPKLNLSCNNRKFADNQFKKMGIILVEVETHELRLYETNHELI